MPRFERTKAGVHQFWEAEREGATTTFRFGQVGTDGRARSKTHRSVERAKWVVAEGISTMTAQGYHRCVEAAVPRADPLQQRVHTAPEDQEALAVLADRLIEAGDPRGPLMARALAGQDVDAELEADVEAHAGVDPEFPGQVLRTWRWAHLRHLVVTVAATSVGYADGLDGAREVLTHPASLLLQSLTLTGVDPAILAATPLAQLRRLCLGYPGPTSPPLDLEVLARNLPRLRTLILPSRTPLRGALPASVQHLSVRMGPGILDALRDASLQTLVLRGIDDDLLRTLAGSGFFAQVDQLFLHEYGASSLLHGPGPRRLHLLGRDDADADIAPLAQLENLAELAVRGSPRREELEALRARGIRVRTRVPPPQHLETIVEPPPDLRVIRLERDATYWETGREGFLVHVHHGRVGSRGSWTSRGFDTPEEAMEHMESTIQRKLNERYLRV